MQNYRFAGLRVWWLSFIVFVFALLSFVSTNSAYGCYVLKYAISFSTCNATKLFIQSTETAAIKVFRNISSHSCKNPICHCFYRANLLKDDKLKTKQIGIIALKASLHLITVTWWLFCGHLSYDFSCPRRWRWQNAQQIAINGYGYFIILLLKLISKNCAERIHASKIVRFRKGANLLKFACMICLKFQPRKKTIRICTKKISWDFNPNNTN